MATNKIITKSKYISGLQCEKYLWYLVNEKEVIPKPDVATRYRFDQGHITGEYAKKLYPDGIEVEHNLNFKEHLERSIEYLKERKPLFEAGYMSGNIYARADILVPVEEDEWDLIEVKSATGLKDIYVHDVSFQRFCYMGAGLNIRKCFLMCLDNSYYKDGEIEPDKLLKKKDVTELVIEYSGGLESRINEMGRIIHMPSFPEVNIGRHCTSPYSCPLIDLCWKDMPANNVFNLYSGKDKAVDLYRKGITLIKDIPEDYNLNFKQSIQYECEKTKKPRVDTEAISTFLEKLQNPLYFLDFETFSTAVPIYDNTNSYKRIPFQFSLHRMDMLDEKPVHYSYLADSDEDPRIEVLESLRENIGDRGSILVYYALFEKSLLKELAGDFPEYEEWAYSVVERIIDLYEPFGKFHYYNSVQQGSASVKKVLPAITDKSYDGMDIANGELASVSFLNITHGNRKGELPGSDFILKTRDALEKYCKLDTEGLIYILRELNILANNHRD